MQSGKNITGSGIKFRIIEPIVQLSDFVESFWMTINDSDVDREIVVLPDGRFDIIFSYSEAEGYSAVQRGLDTEPGPGILTARSVMFAISFKLLAIEYLLQNKVAVILNQGQQLPADFWDITIDYLDDFDSFCKKVTQKMLSLIRPDIDSRKQQLFELIYSSRGSLPVKELSDKVFWNSRQINRYFNDQFGISLKAYCNILRFRSALPQIKEGRLFPEQDFADQTHFIKEVKKFAGVVPKELAQNQNDRFILLSTLPKK